MLTIADLGLSPGYNGQLMHYDPDSCKSQDEYENDPLYRARVGWDFAQMAMMHITGVVVLDARDYIYQLAKHYGMIVINRYNRRADIPFTNNSEPVHVALRNGAPPIVLLDNEATLKVEYDDRPINLDLASDLLVEASIQVYNMGGIVAWNTFDFDYFEFCQWKLERRGYSHILQEKFLPCLHLYGINHPPNYVQDDCGVLGFKFWAQFFQQRLGYIPLMIATEYGWGLNESKDDRFPAVSYELRNQYEMETFDSLKSGILMDNTLHKYWREFLGWAKWIWHARGKSDWFDDAIIREDGSTRQEFIDGMIARGPFRLASLEAPPAPTPDPQPDPIPDPVDPPPPPEPKPIPDLKWRVMDPTGQQVGAFILDSNALAKVVAVGGYLQPFNEPKLSLGSQDLSEEVARLTRYLTETQSELEAWKALHAELADKLNTISLHVSPIVEALK